MENFTKQQVLKACISNLHGLIAATSHASAVAQDLNVYARPKQLIAKPYNEAIDNINNALEELELFLESQEEIAPPPPPFG